MDNRYICFLFAYSLAEVINVVSDIENAYAFGTLLSKNPKADASWASCTPEQKQSIIFKVASASPRDLQLIVSGLEDSAR